MININIIYIISILIIIIIVIILIEFLLKKNIKYDKSYNTDTDKDNEILDILNKKYDSSENGLIFRGLENCDDFISQKELDNCITLEIDGPHEKSTPGITVSKHQGATTWLSKGMNPYFYPDTGNNVPYNVLLIFDGILNNKTDSSGCMFIQDANMNGCNIHNSPVCENNNEIAQKYLDTYTTDNKGIVCKFNNKKVMYKQYNKYNDLLADYNKDISEESIKQFKENQQSSFWSSMDLSNNILAIGYLYSTDNINSIYGSKKIAEILQKNIYKKYNIKIPIVQIYRELKSDCNNLTKEECINNKCNWYGNKCNLMQWHKQYTNLKFKDKNNLIDNKFCNKDISSIPCDSNLSNDQQNIYCKKQLNDLDNCEMDAFCKNNYCKYSKAM
jgi:hypothetical protein